MESQAAGIITGVLIAFVLIAIFVLVFRWLWNSTMPEVFAVKELSFGQSLKILILASILFGGHRVVDLPREVSGESVPPATQAE
jgi:succinate dehydrogenase hydrophobic anchor subunit